jgi:NADPH:quinone reductase-like Zn-dependent oxidoreductase
MRAIVCEAFGEPSDVLHLRRHPPPVCGPGEVLVRMHARAINPSDLLTVGGTYARRTALPLVPGWEGVGTVVGGGVDGMGGPLAGRRVLALRGGGTWQELVAVPEVWAVPLPPDIGDDEAAQLYINPLAVWFMLTAELTLAPGDVVVVNAAGSACGRIAAQLARDLGLRLVAVTRSDACAGELLALGATAVVNTATSSPWPVIAGLTDGRGAAAGLDAIGGAAGAAMVDWLAPGATLLAYGLLSGGLLPAGLAGAGARGVTVRDYWLRRWVEAATPEDWHRAFAGMIDRAAGTGTGTGADGQQFRAPLRLPVAGRFDLADIRAALEAVQTPGRAGKILLTG